MPDLKFQQINGGTPTTPTAASIFPYVLDPFGTPSDEIVTFTTLFQGTNISIVNTATSAFGADASLGNGKWFEWGVTDRAMLHFSDLFGGEVSCMQNNIYTVNPTNDIPTGQFVYGTHNILHVPASSTKNIYDIEDGFFGLLYEGSGNIISQATSVTGETLNAGPGTMAFAAGAALLSFNESTGVITWNDALYLIAGDLGGGGHILNNRTIYVDSAFGNITGENIGVDIKDQNVVSATKNRALRTGLGPCEFGDRILGAQVSVTAANNLTLGAGNSNLVGGNTQINAITVANWTAGSEVTLIFSGTPTVKHNTAGGAGTARIFLAGSVDLVAAANTVLCLIYDGTQWQETSRKVA